MEDIWSWKTTFQEPWKTASPWTQTGPCSDTAPYVSYQIPVHKTVVQIILWLQCNRHLSFHNGCLNSNTYICLLMSHFKKVRVGTFWKKTRSTTEGTHFGTWRKKMFFFFQKHFRSYCRGHWNYFNTIQNILCSETYIFSREIKIYFEKYGYWSKPLEYTFVFETLP